MDSKKILVSLVVLFCGYISAQEELTDKETASLCRSDLFMAKTIIMSEASSEYELASACLKRAKTCETNGDVAFYSAVLGVRQNRFTKDSSEFEQLLSESARSKQPFALAWLYKTELANGQEDAAQQHKKTLEVERQAKGDDYPDLPMALRIASKFME